MNHFHPFDGSKCRFRLKELVVGCLPSLPAYSKLLNAVFEFVLISSAVKGCLMMTSNITMIEFGSTFNPFLTDVCIGIQVFLTLTSVERFSFFRKLKNDDWWEQKFYYVSIIGKKGFCYFLIDAYVNLWRIFFLISKDCFDQQIWVPLEGKLLYFEFKPQEFVFD